MDAAIERLQKLTAEGNHLQYRTDALSYFDNIVHKTLTKSLRAAQTLPQCQSALASAEEHLQSVYDHAINGVVSGLQIHIWLMFAVEDFKLNKQRLTEMYSTRIAELESAVGDVAIASS
jgi:hypothetical protein